MMLSSAPAAALVSSQSEVQWHALVMRAFGRHAWFNRMAAYMMHHKRELPPGNHPSASCPHPEGSMIRNGNQHCRYLTCRRCAARVAYEPTKRGPEQEMCYRAQVGAAVEPPGVWNQEAKVRTKSSSGSASAASSVPRKGQQDLARRIEMDAMQSSLQQQSQTIHQLQTALSQTLHSSGAPPGTCSEGPAPSSSYSTAAAAPQIPMSTTPGLEQVLHEIHFAVSGLAQQQQQMISAMSSLQERVSVIENQEDNALDLEEFELFDPEATVFPDHNL